MKFQNLIPGINKVKQFLSDDKSDGIQKAYYVWDYNMNGVVAFDSLALFQFNVQRYNQQNVFFNKHIVVPPKTLQSMDVTKAKIHVFRNADPKQVLTEFIDANGLLNLDYCGYAFGYFPAQCEITIIEVDF